MAAARSHSAVDPPSAARIRRSLQAALGRCPADTVITRVSLINVYSGEIFPEGSLAISGDRIVHAGAARPELAGPKTKVIDGQGGVLLPGLIDAHTHLDSMFTCAAYAAYALATGNTTAVTEMAMIGNAVGRTGIDWFMEEAGGLPMRIRFLAPALTPPFPELETSRGLRRGEFASLLKNRDVLGIGEAYWPRVTGLDPRVLEGYALAQRLNKTREGHAAGARNENLTAYVAAGTTSCHESTTLEEALERLRLGLAVMIREGMVRRELEAVAPLAQKGVDLHRVMLVSDTFDPADLVRGQGMTALLARAVKLGIPPVTAVQMLTRNPADYYHLRDLGGIAPGKLADLVLVNDLRAFECLRVWVGGRQVAEEGHVLLPPVPFAYPPEARQSFSLPPIQPDVFAVTASGSESTVRIVKAAGATITRETKVRLLARQGRLVSDPERDILKMAVFSRLDERGRPALGFAEGIGLQSGAVASSLNWDTNNILVIGVSDREMALAVNRLIEMGGGLVVVEGEKVLTTIPLPIMGLISEAPLPELARQIQALEQAFRTLGSDLDNPFLTLQTFCFTGLPFIRLTDQGLADIRTRTFLDLVVQE